MMAEESWFPRFLVLLSGFLEIYICVYILCDYVWGGCSFGLFDFFGEIGDFSLGI